MQSREPSAGDDPDFAEVPPAEPPEYETVPTSAADVESAGRSCLVILALAIVIILILLIWVVVRTTAN